MIIKKVFIYWYRIDFVCFLVNKCNNNGKNNIYVVVNLKFCDDMCFWGGGGGW